MGKIIYLMGKSSVGKDTIFKKLLKTGTMELETIVPYTTRPIREREQNGVEYFFTDEEGFWNFMNSGKVIEERAYHTIHGLWRYFMVDDGQICLDTKNYLMIGTLEAYQKVKEYFGENKLLPVLIEVDDGVRLQRALNRERGQQNPKYEELCRRFLADAADFSEEKIKEAGITRRFYNSNLSVCLKEIENYIKKGVI